MRRIVLFAAGVVTTAAVLVWGGCATVIDLGEEVRARPAPVEASVEAAPPSSTCGLQGVTSADCRACNESHCCAEFRACADDPACVKALDCIQDCMAQFACVTPCFGSSEKVRAVVACTLGPCPQCAPGVDCQQLGACASLLEKGSLQRTVARGRILELDPTECNKQRLLIGSQLDASAVNGDAAVCY